MSIFFDFEVSGHQFRRAVDADKGDVEALGDPVINQRWFGEVDIGRLIELSTLSICLIDEQKSVQGFMSLCDHPNDPAVPPQAWEEWMRNMYQRFYLSRNTLFVHYMTCSERVASNFVELALRSVFGNDAYLKQIVFLVPPKCPPGVIGRYATFHYRKIQKIYPKLEELTDTQHLRVISRGDLCPKITVRRGVEEDNDEIVEILDKQCRLLKEMYGNYYVSEIIGNRPPTNRKIIVAECQEAVVGVMCLNSDINYHKLQETYELRPYYGLRKATALEKEKVKIGNSLLNKFGEPIMNGEFGPFDKIMRFEKQSVEDRTKSREFGKLQHSSKVSNKVNFGGAASSRKSIDQNYRLPDAVSDDVLSEQVLLETNLCSWPQGPFLEGDPFDYDIVNIDSNLLAVPSALSLDMYGNISKQTSIETLVKKKPPQKRRRKKFRKSAVIDDDQIDKITYQGGPNAFAIELFGMKEGIDETSSYDLLAAAFDTMPSADYCIIRVPTSSKSFSLLQHFSFVPLKRTITSEYALYVAHRSSVFGKLRVREAEFADVPQISNFLVGLDARESIWAVEHGVRHPRKHQSYILLSGLYVVGVGILEPAEQVEYIRSSYDLDSFHTHKYHFHGAGSEPAFSCLKTALVTPAFEPHFRFFARELLRLSGSTALLWLTAYRNKWVLNKANTLVAAMVPALPRRSEIDCLTIPELRRLRSLSKDIIPFSSWFLDKKLTSIPKVTVNSRLVVVGASDTALGFLDALLFSDAASYLTFTEVTVVAIHGLPYTRLSKPAAELMFLKHRYNADKYLKSVPYTYYVNLVPAQMSKIDRSNKSITLSNGTKCFYDKLFLLLGKQHQYPAYMNQNFDKQIVIQEGHPRPYMRLDTPRLTDSELQLAKGEAPENVFVINEVTSANHALDVVSEIMWGDPNYKIIVYGASIQAYCCLTALLKMKASPQNIVFVEPFPPSLETRTRVPVFENVYVDHTVREVLNTLGIKVYSGYYFENWTVTEYNVASHVDFLSSHHLIRLECSAMFYYDERGVDAQAFNAISKIGMAYNGGTLIDHQFRTRDHSIYAAGPGTRYYWKYHAESRRHKYYDSFEVGQMLGAMIRNELDPLFNSSKKTDLNKPMKERRRGSSIFDVLEQELFKDNERCDSSDIPAEEKLPVFRRPLVTHCRLPGGLQYLYVRAPGKKTPHQYVQSLEYNGVVIETFKEGYFKLHFTEDLVVDGITCLTQTKISLDNFKNLYGLSTVVLNNVYLRYGTKQLDNLYEYFCAPWAYYLYHDRHEELFSVVKELVPLGGSNNVTLKEALSFIGDRLSNASYQANTKSKLRSVFEKSAHVGAITDQVIEWLSEYEKLLPMYLQPSQALLYETGIQSNPCFARRKRRLVKMIWM